jgi:hypothetical protein
VTIAPRMISEDPPVVAAARAHELRHASDLDLVAIGLPDPDRLTIETSGFEEQAQIARAFWSDELATVIEGA